jgi:hypothetical protein
MKINPFSGNQSKGNGRIYVTKAMRRNRAGMASCWARIDASDVVNFLYEINIMDSMDDVYIS